MMHSPIIPYKRQPHLCGHEQQLSVVFVKVSMLLTCRHVLYFVFQLVEFHKLTGLTSLSQRLFNECSPDCVLRVGKVGDCECCMR